jgi:hypothetical protein
MNLGLRYSYFGVYNEWTRRCRTFTRVDSTGNIIPDVNPFKFWCLQYLLPQAWADQ